jgi:hypothetical protein
VFTPLAAVFSGDLLAGVATVAVYASITAVFIDLWLTFRLERQLKQAGVPALDALTHECLSAGKTPQYRVCVVADGEATRAQLICMDMRSAHSSDRSCIEERSFHGDGIGVMTELIEYREELEAQAEERNCQARYQYLQSVQRIGQAQEMRALLARV